MSTSSTMQERPVLYSFRRCPYAMRARMAVFSSGQRCELREVVLRDKPAEMIAASPKATVPVLIDTNGEILEESLVIMHWALGRNDPENLLTPTRGEKADMLALISQIDGPFKIHLDRYKYWTRYDEQDNAMTQNCHREAAVKILQDLEERLKSQQFLFGERLSLADIAIAPFVRQFANTDAKWFTVQPLPKLQSWLDDFINSELFLACMDKYERWQSPSAGIVFPPLERR